MTASEPPQGGGIDQWLLPEGRLLCCLDECAERVSQANPGVLHITEVRGSAGLSLAARLAKGLSLTVLYVVPDPETARSARADARFHWSLLDPGADDSQAPIALLAPEESPYSQLYPDRKALMAYSASLGRLAEPDSPPLVVTTAATLVRRVVSGHFVRQATQRLRVGTSIDRESFTDALVRMGYLRLPIVEDPGSLAVRGGIVDLWSPGANLPVRLELEGDTVARIREFDPNDQRTRADRGSYSALPARPRIASPEINQRVRQSLRALCDAVNWPSSRARELADEVVDGRPFLGSEGYLPAYAEMVPLLDYLAPEACVVFEDAPACVAAIRQELQSLATAEAAISDRPHYGLDAWMVTAEQLSALLAARRVVALLHGSQAGKRGATDLDWLELTPERVPSLATAGLEHLLKGPGATDQRGHASGIEQLVKLIHSWQASDFRVYVTARTSSQIDRLATLLRHRGIAVHSEPATPASSGPGVVNLLIGSLARGAVMPLERAVFVTEEEIFARRAHTRTQGNTTAKSRVALVDLRSLAPGDLVVHEEHGIGRYLGLERRLVDGVAVEFLGIEYEGGKLYLPVYRLNQVQKHTSGDALPRLDRLGGLSFAKTKAKVQRRLRQLADDLLHLYSERLAARKAPLPAPDDDYAAFEASFPFEETRDQAAAIDEVLSDLQSESVMDRLVCGDVGFGKTEVALRAAFRVAIAGRQVAVLCPTTVLAQQHFLTFQSRLAQFGLEVRVLSRLVQARQVTETLERIRQGTIDVVVGTHRLLSKDVFFRRLGLLVVDEEQRFGVAHKERIKQLRNEVDVLTLSATPIPRTLQLALGGLRALSVIDTPPVDRRPIRTIIARPEPDLVAQAVRNELSRGGQVFYVYNRIDGLEERAQRVKTLVPEARVAVAHGQMRPEQLERTMLRFVSGEHDVLVSTAIIESGLDIPRANTMLIDRPDRFGLSQLYQLRGRIGRSAERAYCYLLTPGLSELDSDARNRLETIERFTDLGMGLRVAAIDMELRGTGDLLGAEQSGFVASVGFELFCRMLEDAARAARGQPVVHEVEPDISVDIEALIPEQYIADVGIRLGYYKQLAGAESASAVTELAAEIEDRFGVAPREVRHLFALMRLKPELRRLKVLGCDARASSVSLSLRSDTPISLECMSELERVAPASYRITPDSRLLRRAREGEHFTDGIAHAERVLAELRACLARTSSHDPAGYPSVPLHPAAAQR